MPNYFIPFVGYRGTDSERFWAKVKISDTGCWEWTAYKTKRGYGRYYSSAKQKVMLAHIWSYTEYVSSVSKGLQLDHLCHNPKCVNPLHLEPVTGRENKRRGLGFAGKQARQTHCKRGHLLLGENLYTYKGMRQCRICIKIRNFRHKQNRKQKSLK